MKTSFTAKLFRLGLAAGLITTGIQGANAQCSDAGTADATADSICYGTSTNLTLTAYIGTIQWQSFNGTSWVDEAGPGSTTDNYQVSINQTTEYRAIVTQAPCTPDTSNIITITVGTIPVPTANAVTRCGPGFVNLSGVGNGTLQWYTDPAATVPFATGNPVSVFIPASTTLYVADQSLGGGGGGASSPIQITEMELDLTDHLEIQNVGPIPVDVTGWKVAINNSYTDINNVNTIVQTLTGTMNPGETKTWADVATTPYIYWGNNMLWNPGTYPSFTGWALILDDQNNLKDFVPLNWPAASIQSMSVVINGATVTPGSIWNGDGVNIASTTGTLSVQRVVSEDHNDATDFTNQTTSPNVSNTGLTYPFTGFGCNSPKVPVAVTITSSDPVTISASATNFCLSGSASLTASSNNSNYTYTWSPSTGLSATTGASVTCTPTGPGAITYVVIGDDGTCSNVDSVTIEVGTPTAAGTAITYADTICSGFDTDLLLNGSSGTIQWQSWNGSVWVNETGPGFNTASYSVAPSSNTTYRAYLSSGSCPPDSSNSIDITVVTVQSPVTTDSTVCGGGTATLYATGGQGTLYWYASPTSGQVINQGGSYTLTSTTTTTVYVEEFAGTMYSIGPVNPAIGSQGISASSDWGLGFDVLRDVTIDYVYVQPAQTGNVTINLRQTQGGPILNTVTQAVTGNTGLIPIYLNFAVPTGTGYRLELAASSVQCYRNTTGAVYPYTVPNGPLTITGFLNPALNTTGTTYQFLYNWHVSEGCRSPRIPATFTVNPYPSVPVIAQNQNVLTSSAATGNQWIFNGSVMPGETNQTLTISQTGTYAVAVTVNGCTTLSQNFIVTSVGIQDISGTSMMIFPNPADDVLNISFAQPVNVQAVYVYDVTGRLVLSPSQVASANGITLDISGLMEGIYTLEVNTDSGKGITKFSVAR